MAKLKKLPKRPKASASYETWQGWFAKVNEVKKFNAKVNADKKKKAALIAKARTITSKSVR